MGPVNGKCGDDAVGTDRNNTTIQSITKTFWRENRNLLDTVNDRVANNDKVFEFYLESKLSDVSNSPVFGGNDKWMVANGRSNGGSRATTTFSIWNYHSREYGVDANKKKKVDLEIWNRVIGWLLTINIV